MALPPLQTPLLLASGRRGGAAAHYSNSPDSPSSIKCKGSHHPTRRDGKAPSIRRKRDLFIGTFASDPLQHRPAVHSDEETHAALDCSHGHQHVSSIRTNDWLGRTTPGTGRFRDAPQSLACGKIEQFECRSRNWRLWRTRVVVRALSDGGDGQRRRDQQPFAGGIKHQLMPEVELYGRYRRGRLAQFPVKRQAGRPLQES